MTIVERRFVTDDLDVAANALGHAFPGSRLWLSEIEPGFTFSLQARRSEDVQRVEQRLGARMSAVGAPGSDVVIVWSTSGTARYGDAQTPADTALFWCGVDEPLAATVEHAGLTSVAVPAARFADRAARLTGTDWAMPLGLVPAATGAPSTLLRAALDSAAALALDEMVEAHPLLRSQALDAVVAHALVLFGLDQAGAVRAVAPRTVRRAVAHIEEHLAEPMTVADVAAAARVSSRGLQALFQRHLDCTPTQYLRRARLQAVRADLLAADPGAQTVSAIAHRWGFRHLGRFAQEYRAQYGEAPGTTLRR